MNEKPDLNLTYIGSPGDAGDQYAGLDRFGRIVNLRWDDTNSATDAVSLQYGYDRNGNRLYMDNQLSGADAFDELYHANGESNGYDGLNQLAAFARGKLSDSGSDSIPDTVTTASRSQTWAPDAIGNFAQVATTIGGTTTTQTRTHNEQNQLTQIKSVTGASTVTVNPSFDAAGNMIEDETGRDFVYDAWNRIVAVEQVAEYGYDALGRRTSILEVVALFPPPGPRLLYYSSQWQVIEEVQMVNVANEPPEEPAFYLVPELAEQYVWSPVYVDAMVARDHFVDGVFASRQYALHDANFNVVAIADTDGDVLERYAYDPYGLFVKLEADFDPWVSGTNYNWVYLHQGGRFHAESGMYHFRNRDYSPTLMRWNRLDPIGFAGGDNNLYQYVGACPLSFVDFDGLAKHNFDWYRNNQGLPGAIKNGNATPVAGVHGQSFSAKGCNGCDVTFTFDAAYYGVFGGRDVRAQNGTYFEISANHSCRNKCDKTFFVNLVNVTDLKTNSPRKYPENDPARRGSLIGKPGDPNHGWRIDTANGKGGDPSYGGVYVGGNCSRAAAGNSKMDAGMADHPIFITGDNNQRDFAFCLVCESGGKRSVIACVTWTQTQNNGSITHSIPVATCGAHPAFQDALRRFNIDRQSSHIIK